MSKKLRKASTSKFKEKIKFKNMYNKERTDQDQENYQKEQISV